MGEAGGLVEVVFRAPWEPGGTEEQAAAPPPAAAEATEPAERPAWQRSTSFVLRPARDAPDADLRTSRVPARPSASAPRPSGPRVAEGMSRLPTT